MLDVAHAHDLDGVRVHEYRQYYKITYTDLCVYIFVEEATSGGLPLPSSFLASSYPSDLLLYCQTMKTRGWGEGRRLFQGRRRKRRESSGSWGECCLVRGLTCYSEMMMLFYSLCFPIFFNHKEYDCVCVCVCISVLGPGFIPLNYCFSTFNHQSACSIGSTASVLTCRNALRSAASRR